MNYTHTTIILMNMNDFTAETVYDFLEGWEYTALQVRNPETLLPILDAENRNLILFQFQEFSDDEYALFASIRNTSPWVPILATSPFISIRDTIRLIKAGASDYISQPFTPRELKKIIDEYVATSE